MTNLSASKKLVAGALLMGGIGFTGQLLACPAPIVLPAASPTNSVTFGDGISYSLPILGLDVQSAPGLISDCLVVATGSSGMPINTNVAGTDNAYATPTGVAGLPYFRTGDPLSSPDPGGVVPFTGQTTTTWDAQLSTLSDFLDGNALVVYFNHNQTNSGGAIDQDLFVWAQIAIVDNDGVLPTQYFYITSIPNATGIENFGAPGFDPHNYTGPQTAATNTYPTGSDGAGFPTGGEGTGTGNGDANFFIRAIGQVCLNGPVGVGTPIPCDGSGGPVIATVNENLGADRVASAVIFPEIQEILDMAGFGGYDVLQADIRMGCNAATITGGECVPGSVLNNGFEQIFLAQAIILVPEPATLGLFGLGLLGLGVIARRRRKA